MTDKTSIPVDIDELVSFIDFPKKHQNISVNQLEWLYRHRKEKGMTDVFCKIGRRRYVITHRLVDALVGNNP